MPVLRSLAASRRGRPGRGHPAGAAAGQRRRQHVDPRLRPGPPPHWPGADRGGRAGAAAGAGRGRVPVQPRDRRRRRHDGRLRRRPPVHRAGRGGRRRPRRGAGRRGAPFHPGVQYRHILVAPADWADAECTPPHDLSDKPAVLADRPGGPEAAGAHGAPAGRSSARFGLEGEPGLALGTGRRSRSCRRCATRTAWTARCAPRSTSSAGSRVLTGMGIVEVDGATGWYDTNYEGKRDAALATLAGGADLFLVHVEATDEAGHAGNLEAKVQALEDWDRRILAGLVDGLEDLGPWRLLLLPGPPDAGPAQDPHHRLGAIPARRLRRRRPRRRVHRARHRRVHRRPRPHPDGAPRGRPS